MHIIYWNKLWLIRIFFVNTPLSDFLFAVVVCFLASTMKQFLNPGDIDVIFCCSVHFTIICYVKSSQLKAGECNHVYLLGFSYLLVNLCLYITVLMADNTESSGDPYFIVFMNHLFCYSFTSVWWSTCSCAPVIFDVLHQIWCIK